MPAWDDIITPNVPLTEIFIRGTVTFLALTAMMRVVGQRETGGLGLTDLLVVVLVAQAVDSGLAGDTASSVLDGLLLVAVILFWSVLLDAMSYRWPRLARFVKSRPETLIEDGRLNRRTMRREFLTYDEVLSQLRLHGLENVDQVSRAYIEPNGLVSVIPRKGQGPPG